jgi:hypothetical protein
MTRGRNNGGAATSVRILIGLVVVASVGSLAASLDDAEEAISSRPWTFVGFLAITSALQLMAVRIRDRGAISVAGIAFLATGFTLGVGPAILTAFAAAAVHAFRSRPPLHRAIFNGAAFSLAAGAASGLYHLLETANTTTAEQVAIAFVSGAIFALLNVGLLTLAMSRSEQRGVVDVWTERLRWLTPYYLAFGVLALASTLAYQDFGFLALLAFAIPPAALVLRAARPRRVHASA